MPYPAPASARPQNSIRKTQVKGENHRSPHKSFELKANGGCRCGCRCGMYNVECGDPKEGRLDILYFLSNVDSQEKPTAIVLYNTLHIARALQRCTHPRVGVLLSIVELKSRLRYEIRSHRPSPPSTVDPSRLAGRSPPCPVPPTRGNRSRQTEQQNQHNAATSSFFPSFRTTPPTEWE